MLVYRITLSKFANSLKASGRPARWNSNHIEVIYTASSQSLACLENVVHRSSLGLTQNFSLLTIAIPDDFLIKTLKIKDLDAAWREFDYLPYTQNIGNDWAKKNEAPVLKVPSAIIGQESNYLMNPHHPEFSKIKVISKEVFTFDSRIKS